MNRIKYFTLVALALGSVAAFAAKDSTFHVQNSVRVGYDDNVYLVDGGSKEDTAFISDIVNISGELTFSDRSDLELFWQPEFRYRFDADPKETFYQDLYAKLSHALSQRTFFQLSDRLRYKEKDGQSNLGASNDQNYLENDLQGSLNLTLNSQSQLTVGGGYELRRWEDKTYGDANDYDKFKANGSYSREIQSDTTTAMVGVNYSDHEYNGSRGGFNSTTLYGGFDHTFNPNLSGTAQLGFSASSVDGASGSEDTSSPFLQAGLEYNPTDRTSINGSLGYSLSHAENSVYNAQEGIDATIGVRHDLTGKISISSALSYIFSMYDSAYSASGLLPDAEEDYVNFSLRGSYQINRNNFVDIGYAFTQRASDSASLNEYTRNRVDFGWRLRL